MTITSERDQYFSESYTSARAKFRDAAGRSGWSLTQFDCEMPGPGQERLTCDVAILGAGDCDRTLIVSSGLHGLEGFLGSAVQLALLTNWSAYQAADVRTVFIHALNPFGFAWLRRADAENIDPNRNFVLDPSEYHGVHPLYARLNGLLNPRQPPDSGDRFRLRAAGAIARYGLKALKQAIAEGQYEFPQGIFYGGRHPCWTRRLLEEQMSQWIGACSAVVHIDFHTGLGKWGARKLLVDYAPTSAERAWFDEHFGAGALQELARPGADYRSRGALGAWCRHRYPSVQYLYACAEFGAYGPVRTLEALRAENQAHHWTAADDPRHRRAKQRILEMFAPRSSAWRQMVVGHGADVVQRAVKGLQSPPSVNKKPVE